LKVDIVFKIEDLDEREKRMKVGIISSQECQYSKNAVDFQQPCTMTMEGSTPINDRCVLPPI